MQREIQTNIQVDPVANFLITDTITRPDQEISLWTTRTSRHETVTRLIYMDDMDVATETDKSLSKSTWNICVINS